MQKFTLGNPVDPTAMVYLRREYDGRWNAAISRTWDPLEITGSGKFPLAYNALSMAINELANWFVFHARAWEVSKLAKHIVDTDIESELVVAFGKDCPESRLHILRAAGIWRDTHSRGFVWPVAESALQEA